MNFWREALSDGGKASTSRLLMVYHALIGTAWVTFTVHKTGILPDAVTLAGITAFVTSPYVINTAKNVATAFAPAKPNGGNGANSAT